MFQGAQNIIKPDPAVMKEAYNPRNVWRNREGAGMPCEREREKGGERERERERGEGGERKEERDWLTRSTL